MKITGVEVFPAKMEFIIPFTVSTSSLSLVREHVIVVIHTDEGIDGIGEAVLTPVFHEETVGSVLFNVRKHYGPALIGEDPFDIEEIKKIVRQTVGREVDIRVDANQGWTADKAIRIIRTMEKYDLQLIEQPVPAWDLEGMARISRAIDTPIMADESLFSPQTALRIIRMEAADILNKDHEARWALQLQKGSYDG